VKKVLVTAGNRSETTFLGVCYAVREVLDGVESIYIFDTVESSEYADKTGRCTKVRSILGNIEITTSIITDENLQTIIPEKISRLIRNYGIEDVIVDLSNGQKITAGVLYAVSTISRIPNIFALDFHVQVDKDTRISNLNYPDDWDYVRIQPLKEILNITQSSYVELVYYRDRIETISSSLEGKNLPFATDVKEKIEQSLIDYFTSSVEGGVSQERLARCVNGLGKICEDISIIWYDYCYRNGIITTPAKDFNSRVKQIINQWERYRKEIEIKDRDTKAAEIFIKSVAPTIAADIPLEVMRVYRNLTSHSDRRFNCTKDDARLALDLTLMVLERLSQSEIVVQPEREENETP